MSKISTWKKLVGAALICGAVNVPANVLAEAFCVSNVVNTSKCEAEEIYCNEEKVLNDWVYAPPLAKLCNATIDKKTELEQAQKSISSLNTSSAKLVDSIQSLADERDDLLRDNEKKLRKIRRLEKRVKYLGSR